MSNYLQVMFFQNRVLDYLVAGLIFFGTLAGVWFLRYLLNKLNPPCDKPRIFRDFIDVVLKQSLFPVLQFLSFFFAVEYLDVRPQTHKAMHVYATVVLTIGA